MIPIPEQELQAGVRSLGNRAFSTYDLILVFQQMYPVTWQSLEDEYGKGGAGAGRHYSAYSRIAHALNKLSKTEYITKLDYRPSPTGYGNSIIRYWAFTTSEQDYPDEIQNPDAVTEGSKTTVVVNKYERNSGARYKCIKKWGVNCVVCNFNFENIYGDRGAGFIHVHHLVPLSEVGEEYQLDPIKDLRPVCPNCHAMLHRTIPAISVEQLIDLLKQSSKPE
ncbi:MAG: HNH endonuclease [Methylobacter sp.]